MGPYELSFQERLDDDDSRFARSNPGSPGSSSEKAVPWAAIIPAVADIFSYFGNRDDSDRRLNQQRQWQVEDWNRQNEYNSPAAVMARLRSAGINPDIVAGGASSNAAMPAQGSVPTSSQSMSLGSISRIAELREQARLQNDLVKSEINLNNANAEGARAGIEHGSRSLDIEEFKTRIQRDLASSQINLNDAQIQELASRSNLLFQQMEGVRLDNDRKTFENLHLQDVFDMTVEAHKSQMDLSYHQVRLLKQQYDQASQKFVKDMEIVQQLIDKGERDKARQQYDNAYSDFVSTLLKSDNFFAQGAGIFMRLIDKTLDRISFGLSPSLK